MPNSPLNFFHSLRPRKQLNIQSPIASLIHTYTEREERMEACFLSSNVFTKTTELSIPGIKAKHRTSPRKNCFSHNYKHGISLTFCQMGGSSSDESMSPIVTGDWRSFRAKLVAAEKISMPGDSTSSATGTTDDDSVNSAISDKWAHPIHEPERGCLLIATEKLDGVHIFERTVVLVIATGPLGPTGLILNRPSLMSIKETKSTVMDQSNTFLDRPLYFGGPLEEGLFLVSSPSGGDDVVGRSGVFDEVMKGLYYGTRESVGCAAEMVKRGMIGMDDIRFFDGYCGWEKEQLQDEIRAGYWTVAACSHTVIGLETVNSGGMWEEILGLMGQKKVW